MTTRETAPTIPRHLIIGVGDKIPSSGFGFPLPSTPHNEIGPSQLTHDYVSPEWMKNTRYPLSLRNMPLIEYAFEHIRWTEEELLNDPGLKRYLEHGDRPLPFIITPQEVVRKDNSILSVGTSYTHPDFSQPLKLYAFIPGWKYEFPQRSLLLSQVNRKAEVMGIFSYLPLRPVYDSDSVIRAKTVDGFVTLPIQEILLADK